MFRVTVKSLTLVKLTELVAGPEKLTAMVSSVMRYSQISETGIRLCLAAARRWLARIFSAAPVTAASTGPQVDPGATFIAGFRRLSSTQGAGRLPLPHPDEGVGQAGRQEEGEQVVGAEDLARAKKLIGRLGNFVSAVGSSNPRYTVGRSSDIGTNGANETLESPASCCEETSAKAKSL